MTQQRLEIYLADHEPSTYVGRLGYERLRGNAVYDFAYHQTWLQTHPALSLSGDLQNFIGLQHKSGCLFGCFADALPDRWGRRLIDKREQMFAVREGRVPRTLSDYDYLTLLDDYSRIGAFRFADSTTGDYVGTDFNGLSVPPLTTIAQFTQQAQTYEQNGGDLPLEWVDNLYRQGSSLGGARPKANMQDEDGVLYIAKVPSVHDEYDIALWEHFASKLAKRAGITVAETRLLPVPGFAHHALLSKRFDRKGKQRVHFASAMTLTNLSDGADASSGNGYLDIVDAIIGNVGVAQPEKNLAELYRRVAFSICIGNHDDHFRNHGFLLTAGGWTLSPAYDINPTNQMTQSLLISEDSCEASLTALEHAATSYMLSNAQAKQIISEVCAAVRQWRTIANLCHISPAEQQRFARRIDLCRL